MLSQMKTLVAIAAIPVLAAFAVGCGGNKTDGSAQATESTITESASPGAHGPLKVALADPTLSAAQRADVEKIVAESTARHAASRVARQALAEAVAVQVEKGSIDRAALKPQLDAIATAHAADRAELEQLHAVLDPTQRAALATELESKSAHARKGRGEKHEGTESRRDRKDKMAAWAKDLKLTSEQTLLIRASLAMHRGERGRDRHAKQDKAQLFESFKSDQFVMPPHEGRGGAKSTDRLLGMVETVLPLLTPEQRTLAAQKIRTHEER